MSSHLARCCTPGRTRTRQRCSQTPWCITCASAFSCFRFAFCFVFAADTVWSSLPHEQHVADSCAGLTLNPTRPTRRSVSTFLWSEPRWIRLLILGNACCLESSQRRLQLWCVSHAHMRLNENRETQAPIHSLTPGVTKHVVQAFSSIDWRRYRLARVLGLAPLLLMPLFGFGVFMARSNWLSVVYMGASCNTFGLGNALHVVICALAAKI